jgi:hypothetical protein
MHALRLLTILTLTAQPLAAQAPVVRDSAGITIVENGPRPSAPRTLTLGEPYLRLGQPGGDVSTSFSRDGSRSVVWLSGGRVLINDNWTEIVDQRPMFHPYVKVFDANGRMAELVPLEGTVEPVRALNSLCALGGDTTLAHDANGRAMVVLGPRGEVVARTPLPEGRAPSGTCLRDGSITLAERPDLPAIRTDPDPHVEHFLVDREMRVVRGLGFLPYRRFLPIAHETRFLATGDELILVDSRKTEYQVFTRGGQLTRIVRWADPLRPVVDLDFASGIEKFNVAFPVGSQPRMPVRDANTPSHWPAFSAARVDAAGRVWLLDGREAGSTSWTIFGTDGRLLARFTPPASTETQRWNLMSVGRDALAASVYQPDPEGVLVWLYRLEGLD